MKKKGFATSAILYTMLLLFLVLLVGILSNLQNKKTILDTMKKDTVTALQLSTVVEELLKKVNNIEQLLGGTDVSSIADGTITGIVSELNNSGGTGNGSIRYNAGEDKIQIFANGKWIDWKSGEQSELNFLNTYTLESDFTITKTNASSNCILTSDANSITFTNVANVTSTTTCFWTTNEYIDLSRYNYLDISLSMQYDSVKIEFIDQEGNSLTPKTYSKSGTSGSFNETIDISSYDNISQIRISRVGYDKQNNYAKFTKFLFRN